jgi:hypothetical protein
MLVNYGLSAASATANLAVLEPETESIVSSDQSLDAFKKLLLQDSVVVDHDFSSVIAGFATPLDLATWLIGAKYDELGGAGGILGATITAVVATLNNAGFMRSFQGGVIYWHPNFGAHALYGPILARWRELGAEKGFLGFPTTDVTTGADVRAEGVFAHFQGGSIYWTKPAASNGLTATASVGAISRAALATIVDTPTAVATTAVMPRAVGNVNLAAAVAANVAGKVSTGGNGAAVQPGLTDIRRLGGIDGTVVSDQSVSSAGAFEVHGTIREKYLAFGAEASILGYPLTDETGTPDGIGRFNHFQSGSIYWTPGTYAQEVHGLIRDRWSSLGWERNPQLGYPITDELTPDRRIGHRRPEVRKKPVVSLPSSVIKLPAEAAGAGFPPAILNLPPAAVRNALVAAPPAATPPPSPSLVGALGKLSDRPLVTAQPLAAEAAAAAPLATQPVRINPNLIAPGLLAPDPASTEAEQRSVNRFADFENGVLFWFRGQTSAITLGSIAATSDGTDLSFSGADIASTALAKIGRATLQTANATLASMTFMGTTGYSFDGAQVHNRRHRLQLILQGTEVQNQSLGGGILNVSMPVPVAVTASVELQVEVFFDAAQRRIALAPVDWQLIQAASPTYANLVTSALQARLDPLLWTSFEVVTLPDTDNGDPIAVLSVKTLPNGAVATFVEPRGYLVRPQDVVTNSVQPTVTVFTPPN